MVTETTTRERIIEAAEELMLAKGFHSVGLNEILAAVRVPKGSFYHHFQSKEQFGVEMLRHYVAAATAFRLRVLLAETPEPDPLLRLLGFLDGSIAKLLENDGKCPCLVSKLSAEVAGFSDAMRAVLAEGNQEWIRILTSVIATGIRQRKIRKDLVPAKTAALIQDLWSGAMQRAAVERSVVPLRDAAAFIQTLLRP